MTPLVTTWTSGGVTVQVETECGERSRLRYDLGPWLPVHDAPASPLVATEGQAACNRRHDRAVAVAMILWPED